VALIAAVQGVVQLREAVRWVASVAVIVTSVIMCLHVLHVVRW
jgi:hypothetical protein